MYAGLPKYAFAALPSTGDVIMITRGAEAFQFYDLAFGNKTKKGEARARELNELISVSRAQEEAMLIGALFSWDAPLANPAAYDEDGSPVRVGA